MIILGIWGEWVAEAPCNDTCGKLKIFSYAVSMTVSTHPILKSIFTNLNRWTSGNKHLLCDNRYLFVNIEPNFRILRITNIHPKVPVDSIWMPLRV